MRAIIETGGKQYRVAIGDTIQVEKLTTSPVKFPVLFLENNEDVKIGNPHLADAEAVGEIISQQKGPKLIAYTFRKRKGSERKVGHRQELTLIKITDIKG